MDFISFYCNITIISVKLNNDTPVSFIAYQKITSISKNEIWQFFIFAYLQNPAQFFLRRRKQKVICRTANPKCGMTFHGFIHFHFLFSQQIIKFFYYILIHRFHSSIFLYLL